MTRRAERARIDTDRGARTSPGSVTSKMTTAMDSQTLMPSSRGTTAPWGQREGGHVHEGGHYRGAPMAKGLQMGHWSGRIHRTSLSREGNREEQK